MSLKQPRDSYFDLVFKYTKVYSKVYDLEYFLKENIEIGPILLNTISICFYYYSPFAFYILAVQYPWKVVWKFERYFIAFYSNF